VAMKRVFAFCLVLAGIALIYSPCHAAPTLVEKNIFSQDRKPPAPESEVAPAQPTKPGMPISNLQLDGVMIRGGEKRAMIRLKSQVGMTDKKKGQIPYVTARENEQVGDYKVLRIERKSVTLEKDGQNITLGLFAEGKVVIPASAQPQGPQGPVGVPVQQNQQQAAEQQRMQRPQPGEPGQMMQNPGGEQQPPQVTSNLGQEPEMAVDQGILPEEEPPQ